MKKILFVIPSLSGGGAERVVSILANKMSEKGYDITIICLLKEQHVYYTSDKVNVIFIKSNTTNRIKRNIEKFYDFVKNLKKINPDVVVSFTYDCSMITAIATRFIKTKLIISERNDPNNDPNSKILRKIRNMIYKIGDGFVFQTNDAKNYYCEKIKKKSVVIGNPLNENIPKPYNGKRDRRIVCVSRLAPQKNIPLLINAFQDSLDKLQGYKLEIYGEGPLRNELEKYIEDKNLESKIIIKGYSSDVYSDICMADIFVIPSDYEGISNSMLEALALGIPVIATDCPIGGAHTYIKDEVNGMLVEVGNVEEMSSKLATLAKDEIMKNKFSKESIKIRELLNSDNITKQWIKFINLVENENE